MRLQLVNKLTFHTREGVVLLDTGLPADPVHAVGWLHSAYRFK